VWIVDISTIDVTTSADSIATNAIHQRKLIFMTMKLNIKLLLLVVFIFSGCATYVGPPEPIVYYGYYGSYYGPYYWNGPTVVFGAPYGWHGHYYYHGYSRGYYGPHYAPHYGPHRR
jgi:hypothetical protein